MSPERRQWLEKWGVITAIATVLTVALMCAGTLATVAKWAGTLEAVTRNVCEDTTELKKGYAQLPEKYTTKDENLRRWEQHMKKEADERLEIMDNFKCINTKLDKLFELEMRNNRRNN